MIALIDYGIGNLRSVEKALQAAGGTVQLTEDAAVILEADKVVLPGVGAFGDGMKGLKARNLASVLKTVMERQTPFLGICVGMQILFEGSDEAPGQPGLGFLPGWVYRFPDQSLKVPQTGWNQVQVERESKLLKDLPSNSYAYFNHSFYCLASDAQDWLGSSEYGLHYATVVGRGNLYGVQFHPEKSQAVGLQILKNFVEFC